MIRHGIEVPDSESEIKKEQLKQLALYNGTFRQEDLLQLRNNVLPCCRDDWMLFVCVLDDSYSQSSRR